MGHARTPASSRSHQNQKTQIVVRGRNWRLVGSSNTNHSPGNWGQTLVSRFLWLFGTKDLNRTQAPSQIPSRRFVNGHRSVSPPSIFVGLDCKLASSIFRRDPSLSDRWWVPYGVWALDRLWRNSIPQSILQPSGFVRRALQSALQRRKLHTIVRSHCVVTWLHFSWAGFRGIQIDIKKNATKTYARSI